MRATDTSVWPNDVAGDPRELERESPHQLVCFLLSPFDPPEIFGPVLEAVQAACTLCAQNAGIQVECRRADSLHEAKAIHDDIWRHIHAADFLVVDVTGLNPNVMMELGVAAAWRRPGQVILIKAAEDTSRLPFDTFAHRYISYHRSILGDADFLGRLNLAMIQAITPAPYAPPAPTPSASTGLRVDFGEGDRPDLVLSPPVTHRRLVDGCLEYGSFYIFRNSWLLLTGTDYKNLRVRASFRFASVLPGRNDAFFGLSLRNHHFHANWGHLVYLAMDGRVIRTEPQDDIGTRPRDVDVGRISGFNCQDPHFIEIEAEFTDDRLAFKVGNVEGEVQVRDMPYVFTAGKARLCTSLCRVLIREVELTPL